MEFFLTFIEFNDFSEIKESDKFVLNLKIPPLICVLLALW